MNLAFRGRFELKLDQKSRLALPVSFRSCLSPQNPRIVITNSKYNGLNCLDAYSGSDWLELEKRMANLPKLNSDVQAFQRFYLSAGQEVELNSQGRVLVPKTLKEYADLGSDIVLVGMGEKFEIWNKKSWDKIHSSLADNFENILAGLAKLEGSKS